MFKKTKTRFHKNPAATFHFRLQPNTFISASKGKAANHQCLIRGCLRQIQQSSLWICTLTPPGPNILADKTTTVVFEKIQCHCWKKAETRFSCENIYSKLQWKGSMIHALYRNRSFVCKIKKKVLVLFIYLFFQKEKKKKTYLKIARPCRQRAEITCRKAICHHVGGKRMWQR